MDKTEWLNVLSDIFSSFRIRFFQIDPSTDNYSILDLRLREQLYKHYDYRRLFKDMTQSATGSQPIEYCDDFGLRYLILLHSQNDSVFWIAGPYVYELPLLLDSDLELQKFMAKKGLPLSYTDQIKEFFRTISVIPDTLVFRQLTRKFFSKYLGCDVSVTEVLSENMYQTDVRKSSLTPDSTLAYSALEARYELENKMLGAIGKGNISDALYYHNLFMGFNLEYRNESQLRSTKNYLITANTAFRKAVETAYVHPLYIDNLSGQFVREIEHATTEVQLRNLNSNMIRKYCMLVQTYSREQYSPIIRDCLNYIDFHYQESLSLSFFAAKHTVSKNYLSALFHREVKMTMTDYINTTRIRHAILLLNTTSLSMQDITEQCGFSDPNYFTRTFKKIQGMSPLQYRKSILRES